MAESLQRGNPEVNDVQLTNNYRLSEFDCHDGTRCPPELRGNLDRLVANLQKLRDYLGKPVIVLCGYRTPAYNEACGGKPKSEHMEALAADIVVKGMSPRELHATIEKCMADGTIYNGGLGLYDTSKNHFCHYDCGGKGRRWQDVG